MSCIEPVDMAATSERTRKMLDGVQAKMGTVPNI